MVYMETTIVYWGDIGRIEKRMESTTEPQSLGFRHMWALCIRAVTTKPPNCKHWFCFLIRRVGLRPVDREPHC